MIGHGFTTPITHPGGWFGATSVAAVDSGALDLSAVSSPRAYRNHDLTSIHLTWTSAAPAGAAFQVYFDGRLVWEGTDRHVDIPYKLPSGHRLHIDVGTVGVNNRGVDYSDMLVHAGNRAKLAWKGGRWQDTTMTGFRVYASRTPGAAVDMTNVVATLPAAPGGHWADGFGRGGFGRGGFGHAEVDYAWTSGPLRSGTWQFAIEGYDAADNRSAAPPVVSATVAVAPPAPPARPDGKRVWVDAFDPDAETFTLRWNPVT